MRTFEEIFNTTPDATGKAPGRVNLLGEHTDYNDGYVLPIAIPQQTTVSLAVSERETFRVYAANLDCLAEFAPGQPPQAHFAQYIYGCVKLVEGLGFALPPLDFYIHSNIPIGVGLSSSAALEVATLRALRALGDLALDDVTIAKLGQRAETEYAGVQSGIMDQMASSLADTTQMLYLDTRSLERRLLPLPAGTEIVVLDSGISRELSGSAYNQRVAECREAARLLGVKALRDVTEPNRAEALPEPLRRRARHVISENNRVLQAAAGVTAAEFGSLMNASHQSLKEDFEVSIDAMDTLVSHLQHSPGVFGARLTGAGFGGACVALCRAGLAQQIANNVLDFHAADGHKGKLLVPRPLNAIGLSGSIMHQPAYL